MSISSPNFSINNFSLPQFSQSPSNNQQRLLNKIQSQSLVFPDLNNLTLEELQQLNDNEDRQNEFIDNLPQIRELNKMLDDLIVKIEELAGNV